MTRADAAGAVVRSAVARQPLAVHLCNAYTLALCSRDDELATIVDRGDLNLMDGMPLVWFARRLGFVAEGRVYGPDLMVDVLEAGVEEDLGHFLIGGTPEVAARLPDALAELAPGVRVVGMVSPPFRPLTERDVDDLADRVRASGAHVIWVGLGTPKQDVFVDQLRDRVGIPVLAVGAAFDFHTGAKRQAPRWLRERGLEWLYRLLTEPRRLWRRYLVGIPVFLVGLARGAEVFAEDPTSYPPELADQEPT